MTVLAEPALVTWMTQQRERLLSDWRAAIADQHGRRPHAELALLLGRLLDGLVRAAAGDQTPLEEQLRLARAFRTGLGEGDLATQMSWLMRLRAVVRAALRADGFEPREMAQLMDQLDPLLDGAALTLASHWTVSANSVEHELRQAEMMAETLSEAAEQADRIAVQLANLNTVGKLLSTSLDLHELLSKVGEQIFQIHGAAQVLICLNDPEHGLMVRHSWGRDALVPSALVAGGDQDLIMQALARGVLQADEVPNQAEQGPWYEPGCAVIVAPLLVQQTAIGAIVLQDPDGARLVADEQRSFIGAISAQLAIAVQNAQLYADQREFNTTLERRVREATRDLQTERDMLGVMHRISTEVSRTLDVEVLLQSCLDMIGQLVGFQRGTILLVEPETGQLISRATAGDEQEFLIYRLGQGLVGWVAQQKQPVLVADVALDARWAAPDTNPDAPRVGALLAAPLLLQRDLMGVVVLGHDQTGFFTDDHQRLLTASSTAIALGINNALVYDQQERLLEQQNRRVTTERRNSAQRDAILQSLSDGVIVCSDSGSILVANRAASRILNQEVETLVTLRLTELLHDTMGGTAAQLPVLSILRDPYEPSGEPRHYEATLKADQRVIKVSLDPVLLEGKFEEVIGAVAVLRDITREVESDRLKDEFIGTLSHELRTPMTSIKGYTQLMALGSLGPLNDPQKQFLETISSNTERMIAIINDLLDITKIETGSVMAELDVRPLLLAEAISTVLLEHTPRILGRSQRLQLQVPMTLPLVRCDAKRLNQILTNVISNAVKYTPPGGEIAITAAEADEQSVPPEQRVGLRAGRYVRIEVRDTGVGIPLAEQELVFDRFYRVQNALTVEAGGTGLGLTMVRGLVRLFGGRIWLVSAPDAGTTLNFVLPVA